MLYYTKCHAICFSKWNILYSGSGWKNGDCLPDDNKMRAFIAEAPYTGRD